MRNLEGFTGVFVLLIVFALVTGSSAYWLVHEPGILPLAAVLSGCAAWILAFYAYYSPYKGGNFKFQAKIDYLGSIEADLKRLMKFVQEQKRDFSTNEKVLDALKKEHDQLKPIVESDRRIVQAIVAQADKTKRSAVISGYIASFFLGVASSLVASYALNLFSKSG